MDVEKHVKSKEMLSQALSGQKNFDDAVADITNVLSKYSLHLTPGIAQDLFVYVLEELHLKKFTILSKT